MKKTVYILLLCLACMLAGISAAYAEGISGVNGQTRIRADGTAAPDEDSRDWLNGDAEKEKNKNNRYQRLFVDETFVYSMDEKTAKWIKCPNTDNEYIIDVWIRLDALEEGLNGSTSAVKYSYPEKYYLEHYYIRPSTQQLQFLCELEVTGRPDNNISQRQYDANSWENLIPDSIEENIYNAVVKKMGSKHGGLGRTSINDGLEDIFRISI